MLEEFFYHSFPRINTRANETLEQNNLRGITILNNIIKNGLLLAPEVMHLPFKLEKWQNPVVQHRCCFTLINRGMLKQHCQIFGRFSIEWNTSILKEIGIMPVMYLPLFDYNGDDDMKYVGSKFLYRMINYHEYARVCLKEVEEKREEVFKKGNSEEIKDFENDERFFDEMRAFFEGLRNMVYPVDNKKYTEENGYYRQREWKLPGNLKFDGVDIVEKATYEKQIELLSINPAFFSKKINYFGVVYTRAQISFFLKKVCNEHILNHANKIIVPSECVKEVENLLAKSKLNIVVESL